MSKFEWRAGRFYVEIGTELRVDTDARFAARFPSSTWIGTTETISYPNYDGHGNYSYQDNGGYSFGGFSWRSERCTTTGRLSNQYWGSDVVGAKNLADVDLGALPAGTDFLEVFANITRTNAPATFANQAWPTEIQTAERMLLLGGSCLVEQFAGTARLFEIVVEGGHAVLKRYQTARDIGVSTHMIIDKDRTGGGSLGTPGAAYALRQGDSDECSLAYSRDFASAYEAVLSIRPCRLTTA